MEFEWDEVKNHTNRLNHNIDFADAVHIFLDKRRVFRKDTRKDYGEERYQTIGMTEFGILMVVYTIRDNAGVVRLISARKANKREKRAYDLGFLKPYKEP
ncbi:BrnT family toxin [Thalassomonas actiniarum]|uniref:BrnT family toxin n=1 Tax=Thalassomonas actiniarum TaxID=485447 RepID=A0AAF0C099_9GAMM|nr:BrnT family toxin [Thalassomonas actiniarum]WDD98286.1 BrnT family toxin [Thalassomonas actiniarum]